MPEREFHLGQVVLSLRGRDRGRHYLVLRILGERLVAVTDGDRHKVGTPKKKNVRHLAPLEITAEAIARKLAAGAQVTDAEIRGALRSLTQIAEGG